MRKILSYLVLFSMLCMTMLGGITVQASDVVTDYGTIPTQYADADTYPIIVFGADGSIKHAGAKISANDGALLYIRGDYGDWRGKYVLVRKDITWDSVYGNFRSHSNSGTVNDAVIDLGGHTITATSKVLFDMEDYGSKVTMKKVIFKNGTFVLSNNTAIARSIQGGQLDSTFNFAFENITFRTVSGHTSSLFTDYSATSSKMTSNFEFTNCTFDLSANAEQAQTVFELGFDNGDVKENVTVKGGTIIGGNASVVPCKVNYNTSSIIFDKNSSDKYTEFAYPKETYVADYRFADSTGAELALSMLRDEGDYRYFELVDPAAANPGDAVKPITTPYGTIPVEYVDANQYPVIAFNADSTIKYAGKVISSSDANCALYNVRGDWSSNRGKNILVRSNIAWETSYQNLGFHTYQANTVDLGGNTITVSADSLFRLNDKAGNTVNLTIKNGTLVICNQVIGTEIGGASKTGEFNINFEDVNFVLSDNYVASNWLLDDEGQNDAVKSNVRFDGCTFDFSSNCPAGLKAFNVGTSDDKVELDVIVKGGTFIAGYTDLVPYVENNSKSSIKFESNDYMTITRAKGEDVSAYVFKSTADLYLKATLSSSDASYDYYTLTTFTPEVLIANVKYYIDGEKVDTLKGGTLSVGATVVNDGQGRSVKLYVAAYNDNELVGLVPVNHTFGAGEVVYSLPATQVGNFDNVDRVMVMLWNADAISPVTVATELK
ncbi:MAG: hypothetical protein IJB70_03615 [Clostridia bacterium]|nr:hypothetical protein [Clostridia bacterium]